MFNGILFPNCLGGLIIFKNCSCLGLVAYFNNSGGTVDGVDAERIELSSLMVVDVLHLLKEGELVEL